MLEARYICNSLITIKHVQGMLNQIFLNVSFFNGIIFCEYYILPSEKFAEFHFVLIFLSFVSLFLIEHDYVYIAVLR